MISYKISGDGEIYKGYVEISEVRSGTCYAHRKCKVSEIMEALDKQVAFYWTNYRMMCPDFAIN